MIQFDIMIEHILQHFISDKNHKNNLVSNPIYCALNHHLSEETKNVLKLFERKNDIKKFTNLALSDMENTNEEDIIKELVSEEKIVDIFDQDCIKNLSKNDKLLKDLQNPQYK